MSIEYMITIVEIVLIIFLLFRFISREKLREAHVAYLSMLLITWFLGLIVVEYKLIEYPFRVFSYAIKSSFVFEYFLYPSICALFIVNYPEMESLFSKFKYYFYWCTSLTIMEVIQERYTNVISYISWDWYVTWITFAITFYIAQRYNQWFFKRKMIVNNK